VGSIPHWLVFCFTKQYEMAAHLFKIKIEYTKNSNFLIKRIIFTHRIVQNGKVQSVCTVVVSKIFLYSRSTKSFSTNNQTVDNNSNNNKSNVRGTLESSVGYSKSNYLSPKRYELFVSPPAHPRRAKKWKTVQASTNGKNQ
jgi:hypothetical protein